MQSHSGHKKLNQLVEGEAYRRIMAGEAPATLNEFALQLSDWVRETHPTAPLLTPAAIESRIRETWHRRHEMIRGGDC